MLLGPGGERPWGSLPNRSFFGYLIPYQLADFPLNGICQHQPSLDNTELGVMDGQKHRLEERSFLAFHEDLSKDRKPTAPETLSIAQNQAPNRISQGE
ncbi:unnamed protein product [Caretta caretta]